MKKILLLLSLAFTADLFSQKQKSSEHSWLDIGLKGGYGPTVIVNNNIWNDKNIHTAITCGYVYGGKLGWNFNFDHELAADVTLTTFNQKFNVKPADSTNLNYDKNISFSTLNIALLYRHHANGGYMEIGPQMNILKKTSDATTSGNTATDISKNYIPQYYGMVFGFGGSMFGGENFAFLMGTRMTYGFSDLITNTGGRSTTQSYPMNDPRYIPNYKAYKAIHPFAIMLVAEFDFDVG